MTGLVIRQYCFLGLQELAKQPQHRLCARYDCVMVTCCCIIECCLSTFAYI